MKQEYKQHRWPWSAIGVWVLLLAAGAFLTYLPHMGANATSIDGRQHVEVWGWNIAGASLTALAPAFESSHPDTDIVVKVSGTSMQSRFLLSMSSGRGAPDISQLQEREAGKFTRTGKLTDFTPWAMKYKNDFPASFWQSCVVDNRVYAIPWDIAPCGVFYKRWIFDKYGIDPEKIETWDDYIEAGRQIVIKSGGKTRLQPLASNGLKDPFQIFMQQGGGGIFNEAGEIIFDNALNFRALEQVRKLLEAKVDVEIDGHMTTLAICSPIVSIEELQVAYADDSVAAFPGAVWMMQNMKESSKSHAGEWGVFRLPAQERGGLRQSNQGGSVLVVPAQSQHGQRASEFVEYSLCTVDAQLQQYREWGLFPAYLPALRDPRFDQPDPFFGNQHVSTLFAKDFEKLTPMTRTRDWDEAENYIGQTLYAWASERQDSQTYLRETAAALSRRLGRPLAKANTSD